MKIKYAGPKPMISHHGISFKDGKEDKYVYLVIAIQILNAIDKDFDLSKSYSYDTSTKRLTDEEMLQTMLKYEPKLEEEAINEKDAYSKHLEDEIEHIDENSILDHLEKQTLLNNYKIMKEYKIQRAINKIYYMHCIKEICTIIKREHIKEIDVPFFEKYWHVLQTIQGELSSLRNSITTNLKVINNKDDFIAKLFIEGA